MSKSSVHFHSVTLYTWTISSCQPPISLPAG